MLMWGLLVRTKSAYPRTGLSSFFVLALISVVVRIAFALLHPIQDDSQHPFFVKLARGLLGYFKVCRSRTHYEQHPVTDIRENACVVNGNRRRRVQNHPVKQRRQSIQE